MLTVMGGALRCGPAAAQVFTFHFFVDVCSSLAMQSKGPEQLSPYEQAAAAFVFLDFLLSLCAVVFAATVFDELRVGKGRHKPRQEVISARHTTPHHTASHHVTSSRRRRPRRRCWPCLRARARC